MLYTYIYIEVGWFILYVFTICPALLILCYGFYFYSVMLVY